MIHAFRGLRSDSFDYAALKLVVPACYHAIIPRLPHPHSTRTLTTSVYLPSKIARNSPSFDELGRNAGKTSIYIKSGVLLGLVIFLLCRRRVVTTYVIVRVGR